MFVCVHLYMCLHVCACTFVCVHMCVCAYMWRTERSTSAVVLQDYSPFFWRQVRWVVETGRFLGLQWPGVAYLVRSRPMIDLDSNKRWEVLRKWQPRLSSDLYMNLYTDTHIKTLDNSTEKEVKFTHAFTPPITCNSVITETGFSSYWKVHGPPRFSTCLDKQPKTTQ